MTTLEFKQGVRVRTWNKHLTKIINGLVATAPDLYDNVVVCTSINDGQHMLGSLHYQDLAVDIRTHANPDGSLRPGAIVDQTNINRVAVDWCDELQVWLGPSYQVIYEPHKVHIHIEYDPLTPDSIESELEDAPIPRQASTENVMSDTTPPPNAGPIVTAVFQRFLGTKNPLTSITTWGVLILLFGDSVVSFLCSAEAIEFFGYKVCGTATMVNEKVGIALGFIGVRRRLVS